MKKKELKAEIEDLKGTIAGLKARLMEGVTGREPEPLIPDGPCTITFRGDVTDMLPPAAKKSDLRITTGGAVVGIPKVEPLQPKLQAHRVSAAELETLRTELDAAQGTALALEDEVQDLKGLVKNQEDVITNNVNTVRGLQEEIDLLKNRLGVDSEKDATLAVHQMKAGVK